MSRQPAPAIPALKLHKATGQAYVRVHGRMKYLGVHGQPETLRRYRQIIDYMSQHDGQPPPERHADLTVVEMLASFMDHARSYYRDPDGAPTSEVENLRQAIRPLQELYGDSEAASFGPLDLQHVQRHMIGRGLCRTYINRQVDRVRMIFKWAVSQQLVPETVWRSLQSVPGLKRGRSKARESTPVVPVPEDRIAAIEPYVSRQVWSLVQLQLLSGARPGELLRLRPGDIDRSTAVWTARLSEHKTAHHGHERILMFGPKAQQVLQPFLNGRADDVFCFSPREAEADRRRQAHAERVTPPGQGNTIGTSRTARPKVKPRDRYDGDSYRRAIARACDAAFPPPAPLAQRDDETYKQWEKRLVKDGLEERLLQWRKGHRWSPNRLRHNAASRLREEFGIDAAQTVLGHRIGSQVTELYAQPAIAKAQQAMLRTG